MSTLKKARARKWNPGDTRKKDGKEQILVEYKPGKYSWRVVKEGQKDNANTRSKSEKLREVLKKTSDDKLRQFAEKPQNKPDLRLAAYEELESRGVDVSDIDMENGRLGSLKEMVGVNGDVDDPMPEEDNVGSVNALVDKKEEDGEWNNPDFIKKKFSGLKTKRQRIEADKYIYEMKTQLPNYIQPHEQIFDLNRTLGMFFEEENPLLIVSGGAGVGKTWNFKKMGEIYGKREFDPNKDNIGDSDYDIIEAPEIKSKAQLATFLKEHNDKIILFDDADNVLEGDALGILKKATNTSGKRIVGNRSTNQSSNVDPFEFTGKIAILTNKTQHELTKDPHLDAIFSRAVKEDLQFTKREKLNFIRNLKLKFDFTGIPRLDDEEKDKKEREEVFQIIEDNIDNIDPVKFNTRTMREALFTKRKVDNSNKKFETDPAMAKMMFGQKQDWKDVVERVLTKGFVYSKEDEIKKAVETLEL